MKILKLQQGNIIRTTRGNFIKDKNGVLHVLNNQGDIEQLLDGEVVVKPKPKQSTFTKAMIGSAMASDPAIMQASGWKLDNRGNWKQERTKGSDELADNLAILSMSSPTHPLTAATDWAIGAGFNLGRNYLVSRSLNKAINNGIIFNLQVPLNLGWAPKQTISVVHKSNSPAPLTLWNSNRWDVINEGAPANGVWFLGRLGTPRTELTNPGKGIKSAKARRLFADRPYTHEGLLILEKPMLTVGEVPNRAVVERFADLQGADGLIFNNVYDNGYNHNQVIFSLKLPFKSELDWSPKSLKNYLIEYSRKPRRDSRMFYEKQRLQEELSRASLLPEYAKNYGGNMSDAFINHWRRLNSGGFDRVNGNRNIKTYYYNYMHPNKKRDQVYDYYKELFKKEHPEFSDEQIKMSAALQSVTTGFAAEDGSIIMGRGVQDLLNKYGNYNLSMLRHNFNLPISHELDHAVLRPKASPEGIDLSNLSEGLKHYFSLDNGTEMSARFSQIKDWYHLNDDKYPITPDMLKFAKDYYFDNKTEWSGSDNNMREFFLSIVDFDKFAKWGNKYSTGLIPIGISTLNNKNND